MSSCIIDLFCHIILWGDFIKYIIKNYINKLTKNDVISFSLKNNIYLSDSEVNVIYNHIKNNYEVLLYQNSDFIFNDLKNKLSITNYNLVYNLFITYKEKYKNYL